MSGTEYQIHVPPFTIEMMIACYCSPEPDAFLGSSRWNSPAAIKTLAWLKENSLVTPDNRATARGEAWMLHICNTPLPVSKWVLPEREGAE